MNVERQAKLRYYRQKLTEAGVPTETVEKFLDYNERFPMIGLVFKKLALKAIRENQWEGAKSIMEDVRKDPDIKREYGYKCNNSFTAYYARLFVICFPQYRDFFEFRRIKGLKEAA